MTELKCECGAGICVADRRFGCPLTGHNKQFSGHSRCGTPITDPPTPCVKLLDVPGEITALIGSVLEVDPEKVSFEEMLARIRTLKDKIEYQKGRIESFKEDIPRIINLKNEVEAQLLN